LCRILAVVGQRTELEAWPAHRLEIKADADGMTPASAREAVDKSKKL
jgi:hypothetical protein